MLLQKESNPALNTVTAYGDDYIEINKIRYEQSVYFRPEGDIHHLSLNNPSDFTTELLQTLTGVRPAAKNPMAFLDGENTTLENPEQIEVLLIGTGTKQHFLPSPVIMDLLGIGIGVEMMDSQAAARTYNILMSEGRRVVAALLIDK